MFYMSAFVKHYFITITLKPILPGKPRDYSYKSLMSRVLHKPPPDSLLTPPLFYNGQYYVS